MPEWAFLWTIPNAIRPISRARPRPGTRIEIMMAIMAMTTNNSMSVNAPRAPHGLPRLKGLGTRAGCL